MAMDNMTIRKTQLKKLDQYVKELYDETQVFKNYGIDLQDVETLYLHIHELIEELLKCDTTDEFMAKLEQLHKAVAGVLIVMVPANMADQIKADMQGSYEEFDDEAFDEFIQNLHAQGAKTSKTPTKDDEEDPENDPEELMDMLDLKAHVKPKKKSLRPIDEEQDDEDENEDKEDNDTEDPLGDFWESTDN